MTENTASEPIGRLVSDYSPVDSGAGSINAEHFEVNIQDPKTNSQTSRLNPEQTDELRRKFNKIDKEKYFALKLKWNYSMKPGVIFLEGYFETAVALCKTELYYSEVDGNFIGAWLVTEIDHWDNEKERLILLTEKQLIVVRFNFITTKIEDHRKIPLVNCTRIQTSNLGYSSSTFGFYQHTSHRSEQLGIRIHWNTPKVPGTFDYWNPWSRDIPNLTLTSHRSVEVNEASPEFVSFSTFQKSLIAAASSDISRSLVTDEEPIVVSVILGISAIVHNQSKLGFSRDRGGVCY